MDDRQFRLIAKAVADPSRFAALQMIAQQGEVSCSGVCARLDLTPATISHHVKELVEAGLIRQRKEAKFSLLTLNRAVWSAYLKELARRVS